MSKSDFSYLRKRPIWKTSPKNVREEFKEYMATSIYGALETLDAFQHFSAGWYAQKVRSARKLTGGEIDSIQEGP